MPRIFCYSTTDRLDIELYSDFTGERCNRGFNAANDERKTGPHYLRASDGLAMAPPDLGLPRVRPPDYTRFVGEENHSFPGDR